MEIISNDDKVSMKNEMVRDVTYPGMCKKLQCLSTGTCSTTLKNVCTSEEINKKL